MILRKNLLLLCHLPLLTGLVGLRVGGQMVPELVTRYNLGWAAANVPERSVPVVKHDLCLSSNKNRNRVGAGRSFSNLGL